MDPTGHDDLYFWLAHVHPAWMIGALSLAWLALRSGSQLRSLRARRGRGLVALRQRHLRLAKPAVALLVAGFVLGPLSSYFLRDWTPFQTFHALAGSLAVVLFVAASRYGRRLEVGLRAARTTHLRFVLAAMLCAAVAAVSGFVLLP
ncbi:MAG: DUF4079 family protein [Myxococcota bacterium]|nr:DUF4079 family protein [Myxococcota bacterium]